MVDNTTNTISGVLTFIPGGLAPSGYLSGDGYFLFLGWDDVDEGADSLLVGLQPSAGSGLVEAIDDQDKNVVVKVASNDQKFLTVISNKENGKKTKTVYTLNLTFAPHEDELGA